MTMNGGSQRKAIDNNAEYVEAINSEDKIVHITNEYCKFGYRSSMFLTGGLVVAEVGLRLHKTARSAIRKTMLEIIKERSKKFPLKQPSCGSIFLSNHEVFEKLGHPGAILDRLGFKCFRIGGAQVSEKHANFIINAGNATARAVFELVSYLQENVKKQCGIELHCEFNYIDEKSCLQKI